MPRICPLSSSAPRPLGAAYIPILLSEVEQEQRPSGNGDREALTSHMLHIFLLSEHILDHKGVRLSILDKIRSES